MPPLGTHVLSGPLLGPWVLFLGIGGVKLWPPFLIPAQFLRLSILGHPISTQFLQQFVPGEGGKSSRRPLTEAPLPSIVATIRLRASAPQDSPF